MYDKNVIRQNECMNILLSEYIRYYNRNKMLSNKKYKEVTFIFIKPETLNK